MWLITNTAFLSAVEHRGNADLIMVRARRRGDLDEMADVLAGLGRKRPAITTKKAGAVADYPARAVITRDDWIAVAGAYAAGVNYENFKSSVKDRVRHDAYMRVWSALMALEESKLRGSYSGYHGGRFDTRGWSGSGRAHDTLLDLDPVNPIDECEEKIERLRDELARTKSEKLREEIEDEIMEAEDELAELNAEPDPEPEQPKQLQLPAAAPSDLADVWGCLTDAERVAALVDDDLDDESLRGDDANPRHPAGMDDEQWRTYLDETYGAHRAPLVTEEIALNDGRPPWWADGEGKKSTSTS